MRKGGRRNGKTSAEVMAGSLQSDVLVIGGGPAGLAAAIAMRSKGMRVTVVDAGWPPIDKACGEGVLPAGVRALYRLGVRISRSDVFAFRGVRFLGDGGAVEAVFRSEPGLALRRTRLHEILTAHARELGIRLIWGTRAADLADVRACGWIVGADGINSQVRRNAGLGAALSESWRFGFRRHYRVSPWTDFVEVHWGSRCQLYVTPVSEDEIGVALLSRDPGLRMDRALVDFPELQRRLQGAEQSSTERGAVTASRRFRRVCRGRTVLVGDASGSVDAITGEGLTLSFCQALVLAEALYTGDLSFYEAEHRRLSRRPGLAARLLLLLDRFPWLRRSTFKVSAFKAAISGRHLTIQVPMLSLLEGDRRRSCTGFVSS